MTGGHHQEIPSAMKRVWTRIPGEAPLRCGTFNVQAPRTMRAPGYERSHEVRVALPLSYDTTDPPFPVLWVTDNRLEAVISALSYADMIIASVGGGLVEPQLATQRRIYDLYPTDDIYAPGEMGAYLKARDAQLFGDRIPRGGGASAFLDFLIDEVRPALEADYRMDAQDHGLFGFSSGSTFVCYSLFAGPGSFARYICGSPAFAGSADVIFDCEARYAARHDDLPVQLFCAAGEADISELSAWGAVSSMTRFCETLSFRAYPSLRLTVRIFPGETQHTMLHPVLTWGVRALSGERVLQPL
jgi:predicted alpha/beta superfamily hydrolase